MNLESPKIGPNAGKNILTIMVIKEIICDVGRLFQINVVTPPLRPKRVRISVKTFSSREAKKEGIFLMVALVLFLTLYQKDF